jgi:hypothetical protein
MSEWQRDNPWRQGFILKNDSVKMLDLVHPKSGDDTVVLVISHDCDLAQLPDAEPYCEVIAGFPVDDVSGDFANAKNIRRLHLTFSGGQTRLSAEFNATEKRRIDKSVLAAHEPATNVRLTPSEFAILQAWLAARYRRSSFADEFDRRIKQGAAKFYDKFVKIIKASGTNLLAVLFDVDSGQEVNRDGPNDPYLLSIYLLFNVAEDPTEAEAAACSAAKVIRELVTRCFFIDGKWQNIELRECEPISEAAMTVHIARLLKPWNFDYLSLRDDPQGPMSS